MHLVANIDGASRGNPGHAAIGIVIRDGNGKKKEFGECIGKATNNQAEYSAAIKSLKIIKNRCNSKEATVKILADSKLVVEQFNGNYKVKAAKIKPLFIKLSKLKADFRQVTAEHIPREKNKEADKLANKALDECKVRH